MNTGPVFYDYEMLVLNDGTECYLLKRNACGLGHRKFCRIEVRAEGGVVFYDRISQWGSKHSNRVVTFTDLDKAMRSGVEWAVRRSKEDAR